jgi:phage terminase small subunit
MPKSSHLAPLTPRRRLFVEQYLIDLNGKEAAIRAGYSRSRAASRGYALLRLPEIRALIAEAMAQRAARTPITPERVLEEYARIAFSDWRRFARQVQAGALSPVPSSSCCGSSIRVSISPTSRPCARSLGARFRSASPS